ncbi:MAG: hypothetical protein IT318_01115 [Anaerolineales bacterium]|nr:hypothetical protein [Anaerolineales bacterium]
MACTAALEGLGLYKLVRAAHPRWIGMRVNFRDLAAWSFLMATAHGAGLMLAPILIKLGPARPALAAAEHAGHDATTHAAHVMSATASAGLNLPLADLEAVALHTGVMFLLMALIAVVACEKLGVLLLRRTWFNLDRI